MKEKEAIKNFKLAIKKYETKRGKKLDDDQILFSWIFYKSVLFTNEMINQEEKENWKLPKI